MVNKAANMCIAASGARRWSNRPWFAIQQQLSAGRIKPGKCSYFHHQIKPSCSTGGRYKIPHLQQYFNVSCDRQFGLSFECGQT